MLASNWQALQLAPGSPGLPYGTFVPVHVPLLPTETSTELYHKRIFNKTNSATIRATGQFPFILCV